MGLTPEQHQAVDTYLAKHAGDDAPLVKALLTDGELSTGDPAAESPKGARGLMQLTPIAVKDIGLDPDTFPYDNPAENLKGGIAYVKKLRETYGLTNPLQIAAAYNAGPSAVKAAIAKGGIQHLPAETQAYVKRMHAALSQRVNAPAPSAAQDTAPVPDKNGTSPMPIMSDQQDPVDRMALPTDSVYTPPPGAVPGQAGAQIPVNSTPGAAPPESLLATAGKAPFRAVAGLADLGANVLVGPSAIDSPVSPVSTALESVAGPAPDVRSMGGYVDAASQGAAFGAAAGVPAGPIGMATGAVAGAVTGVVSNATANFAERLGLPRIIGGLTGGVLTSGGIAVAKGAAQLGRAAKNEAMSARRALQELDDATVAIEKANRARDAAVAAKQTVAAQNTDDLAAAAKSGKRLTRQAEAERTMADARVENATRNITNAIDDYLVKEKNPVERAALVQRVTQDNRDSVHVFVSKEYDDFLQRADDSGRLVPTSEIVAEAHEIQDALVLSGMPHEAAGAQARAIIQTLAQPGIPFTHAQGLRSSLRGYAFKARQAGQDAAAERFTRLRKEVDRAIVKGLPDDMKPEFAALRRFRRAESRLFENKFVEKLIADTPEGREVAKAYAARLLEGNWSTEKLIGLREVRRALGNTDAGGVLQDAFLRQALADVKGDLTQLSRILRSQDGLGQAARELLDPKAFRQLTELSDEALRAQRVFQMTGSNVANVKRLAGETLEQARERARIAARDATASVQQTQRAVQEAGYRLDAARQGAKGLKSGRFNPQESVLYQIVSLGLSGGSRARSIMFLADPQKRATLLRALRTSASSAKGQEMLRTLAISGAVGQPTPSPATSPRPDAAVPAR